MAKSKVTGSMSKTWLSDIASSKGVKSTVEDVGTSAKRLAETRAGASRSRSTGKRYGFKYFYGSTTLGGEWGSTVLIWGMNPASKARPDILRKAASNAGAREKGGA